MDAAVRVVSPKLETAMPMKGPFHARDLHVIAVISNPARYQSRYRLYREFKDRMKAAGVTLWTCEVAYGERPFEVTSHDDPHALQLRTRHELWHKENMANLVIARLPQDWKYCALIDADVSIVRPDWPVETIHKLQHHQVVQMWREAHDMGPHGQVIQSHKSFMYLYTQGTPIQQISGIQYNCFGHPGFAWAFRREALDHTGGLLDTAILGAADHHMCLALVGESRRTVPGNINPAYLAEVLRWQARAERWLRRDVGYVDTMLLHHFHGKKADRRYVERWKVLIDNDYTPHLDLKRDWQGLYQLSDRSTKLRDDLRRYFHCRNEDSIDL